MSIRKRILDAFKNISSENYGVFYGSCLDVVGSVFEKWKADKKPSEQSDLVKCFLQNFASLSRHYDKRRLHGTSRWPILRCLHKADPQSGAEPYPWLLYVDTESAWHEVFSTLVKVITKKPQERGDDGLGRRNLRANVLELFALEFFHNQQCPPTLHKGVIERATALEANETYFFPAGGEAWRTIDERELQELPEFIRMQPTEILKNIFYWVRTGQRSGKYDFGETLLSVEVTDEPRPKSASRSNFPQGHAPIPTAIEGADSRLGDNVPRPRNVPSLPIHPLPRQCLVDRLKKGLLVPNGDATGTIPACHRVGVYGMAGIGKSVMAALIARDDEVNRAFPAGVFWVRVGKDRPLTLAQRDLGMVAIDSSFHCHDIDDGRIKLEKAFVDKTCLVILDDVWNMNQLEAFDFLSPPSRILFTTRNAGIVTNVGAKPFRIDLLTEPEALELLALWSKHDIRTLPPEANQVVRECGYLPLAIAIVGATVKSKILSWRNILNKLRNADIRKIGRRLNNYPYPNLFKAFHVSVQELSETTRDLYLSLAVFREDDRMPIGALETFWGALGVTPDEVEDILQDLMDQSLLFSEKDDDGLWDVKAGYYLHFLQHYYVRSEVRNLRTLHRQFVQAYRQKYRRGWHEGWDNGYYLDNLVWQMIHAGEKAEAYKLLEDVRWLEMRVAFSPLSSVLKDYHYCSERSSLDSIREAIQMSAHALEAGSFHLPSQLTGRLLDDVGVSSRNLLRGIRRHTEQSWFRPLNRSLAPPKSGLALNISGGLQAGALDAVIIPGTNLLLSCGKMSAIHVWDWPIAANLWRFGFNVHKLAVTSNGHLLVTAMENKVEIWRLNDNSPFARSYPELVVSWSAHRSRIATIALSLDGKFVLTCANGRSFKKWDTETGRKLWEFSGHSGPVTALSVSNDGIYAISGSVDKTIRIWDLENGLLVHTIPCSGSHVSCIKTSPVDEIAFCGSTDGSVRMFNVPEGDTLHTLFGHKKTISALAVSSNGAVLASGSNDGICIWDVYARRRRTYISNYGDKVNALALTHASTHIVQASTSGLRVRRLERLKTAKCATVHSSNVCGVGIAPNGRRAVSLSEDGTLCLWQVAEGKKVCFLTGHTEPISGMHFLSDKNGVLTASLDDTARVWNLQTGKCEAIYRGSGKGLRTAVVAPGDTEICTVSLDGIISAWDSNSSRLISSAKVSPGGAAHLAFVSNRGYLVTCAAKGLVSIWKWPRLRKVVDLQCGEGKTSAFVAIANGQKIVWASEDGKLVVWSLPHRSLVRELSNGLAGITCLNISRCGAFLAAGASHGTVRTWNLRTGEELDDIMIHHAPITSVHFLRNAANCLSSSLDQNIYLHNRSGIMGHFIADAPISSCTVSPDQTIVMAGSADGNVHFLKLEKFALHRCSVSRPSIKCEQEDLVNDVPF